MPRASHRLDVLLVPTDPDRAGDAAAFAAVEAAWRCAGHLTAAGRGALVPGGFARLWFDAPGRVTLFANQQGGFRVTCPTQATNIAVAFSAAVESWRAGGPRALTCPACGARHPLEDATLAPPGAFARYAVVFADARSADPTPEARGALEAALGPLRVIARRVG